MKDLMNINDFVNKIYSFKVPENSVLVTMDVKDFFTHIPNNEGITAVKRKHDNYTKKTIATKIITTLLALILTLNNFIFNSMFHLQVKGCTMGIICAPTYANKFMSEFQERCINLLINNKSSSYLRFTDNIFYDMHQIREPT